MSKEQPEVRYEYLYPDTLDERIRQKPIAYVPIGLLEWHGGHLPLGTDGLKVHALACRLAVRTGGVVLPIVWATRPGFSGFTGTLTYTHELVKRLLTETFNELAKIGIRLIVAVPGHGGAVQQATLRETFQAYAAAPGNPRIQVVEDGQAARALGLRGDHGGPWETSMLQGVCPKLVDMSRFEGRQVGHNDYTVTRDEALADFEQPGFSYTIRGDFSGVTPEACRHRLDVLVQLAVDEVEAAYTATDAAARNG